MKNQDQRNKHPTFSKEEHPIDKIEEMWDRQIMRGDDETPSRRKPQLNTGNDDPKPTKRSEQMSNYEQCI